MVRSLLWGRGMRLILCSLLIAACTTAPDEDGRDDRFTDSSGKADTGGITDGSPDAIAVLHVANTASSEVLREAAPDGVGLSDRTADALLDLRLGDDGVPGTADDGHFDTLAQLDAVPYIGPVAFGKFLAYAKAHPQPIHITVDVTNVAAVVYRDGDGAWTSAAQVDANSFGFDVHGAYSIAYACNYDGYISVQQDAVTPQDGTRRSMSCSGGGTISGMGSTVKVTGHVAHAGGVSVGFASGSSGIDGWDLALDVAPGTYDLIATSQTHLLIQRGLSVTADTALPAIDQNTGAALEHVPFTANLHADEQAYGYVSLVTSGSGFSTVYSGDLGGILLPPAGFVQSTDTLYVQASTYSSTAGRYESREYHAGDPTAFTLPDSIAQPAITVANGTAQVGWTALPADADSVYVSLGGVSGAKSIGYTATLSKSYVAATHVTSIQFPTSAPGLAPLDTTKPYSGSLSIAWTTTTATGSFPRGVWATTTVNGAMPHAQEMAVDQLARARKTLR